MKSLKALVEERKLKRYLCLSLQPRGGEKSARSRYSLYTSS